MRLGAEYNRRPLLIGVAAMAMLWACSGHRKAIARWKDAVPSEAYVDDLRYFLQGCDFPPGLDSFLIAECAPPGAVDTLRAVLVRPNYGPSKQARRALLFERHMYDLEQGTIVLVDGWVMSRTEVSASRLLLDLTS